MVSFPIILNRDNTNCIVTRNNKGINIITNIIYDDINIINHNNKNNNNNNNKIIIINRDITNFGDNFKIKYIDYYHYTCTQNILFMFTITCIKSTLFISYLLTA